MARKWHDVAPTRPPGCGRSGRVRAAGGRWTWRGCESAAARRSDERAAPVSTPRGAKGDAVGAGAEDVRPLLWELVSGVQRLTEQARTLLIAIDPSEMHWPTPSSPSPAAQRGSRPGCLKYWSTVSDRSSCLETPKYDRQSVATWLKRMALDSAGLLRTKSQGASQTGRSERRRAQLTVDSSGCATTAPLCHRPRPETGT